MEQTGKAFLRSSRHAALLALCYFAAVMIPNCILFFTEPYSIWSKAALLTLPAGGYLLWSVAFRRSGIAVWLSFPVIFFCALQIVLLYLFGNSVAATDMFINIVTTNPGEATELLSNIYPSVILVCVIYLPLLWTATVHVRRKVDFSPRFRRRTAVVGGVLALVGAGLLIPAYQTKRHVLRNEIFPVNVAYNVVLCAREYVKIENYDRTSAGFRYHARRTAKADKREIYVYVIGEASRAANWELYGYDRPTNPRLKALGDEIVVFRNMLTQSNTTHKSVPMILSSVRTNEHDELFRRKGLPALFNEAGFRTWFLSNQSPQGAMIDKLARDADSLIYMGHPRYDMQLLDTMKRIVEADTENDLLFITNGGCVESCTVGGQNKATGFDPTIKPGNGWDLWKRIAALDDSFGHPEKFCSQPELTNWESATITTLDEKIPQYIQKICKRDPFSGRTVTGGIVTVKDSKWLMSWTLNRQQQFRAQPKDQLCVWVYGLFSDKPGDYVKKPMRDCTGREICMEWLYHLGVPVEDIAELAEHSANTVPVMMPYIDAFFMPRAKGDRPDIVPKDAVNFAFLGQFAETERDTIFTTEYSMRTGMEAVYRLLNIDRGVPEVWGSTYDVRALVDASVKLRDGRKLTDMELPLMGRIALKEALKKIEGTDLEKFLRQYNAI